MLFLKVVCSTMVSFMFRGSSQDEIQTMTSKFWRWRYYQEQNYYVQSLKREIQLSIAIPLSHLVYITSWMVRNTPYLFVAVLHYLYGMKKQNTPWWRLPDHITVLINFTGIFTLESFVGHQINRPDRLLHFDAIASFSCASFTMASV